MKKLVSVLIFLLTITGTHAQQIVNVRAVASGDTMLLSYDLIGGPTDQTYKISGSCWDGITTTELKSITGLTIVKPGVNHQFRWHVLDDMDMLAGDSVSFTIIAKEYVPIASGWIDKELTPEDRKLLLVMDLTRQIETYLNEVYNQALLWHDYSNGAFAATSGLLKLDEQRKQLNAAYNTLLKNRRSFELIIYTLWKDKAKKPAEEFFKKTLDEMHPQYILKLNDEVIKKMNNYTLFGGKDYKSKRLLEEIKIQTFNLTNPLLTHEIKEAHENANKLYEVLRLY